MSNETIKKTINTQKFDTKQSLEIFEDYRNLKKFQGEDALKNLAWGLIFLEHTFSDDLKIKIEIPWTLFFRDLQTKNHIELFYHEYNEFYHDLFFEISDLSENDAITIFINNEIKEDLNEFLLEERPELFEISIEKLKSSIKFDTYKSN
jgi:hypothetical protein